MDFLLSDHQVQLMSIIFKSNIAPLVSRFTESSKRPPLKRRPSHVMEDIHDSGIESEASTLTVRSQKKQDAKNVASSYGPFHVLLTAGKISFMVYGHRPLGSQDTIENKLFPYLFMNISQPHTFVTCQPHAEQKFELSCFDLLLRGAKNEAYIEEEGKWIPDSVDFSIPWIETRPGKPQRKTGIPPSLYTIRVIDFCRQQGWLHVYMCVQ
jgi:hypothetical protein